MESEFVALTDSIRELIWFSRILVSLNVIKIDIPIQYCDNQAAIYFSKNSIENIKTKHIDIKFQFVRELIKDNLCEIIFVNSKNNCADSFTKPLLREKFNVFINRFFYCSKVE